ncbi:MAG: ammonia channel protein, partial [Calditrichaceae bacterium]
GTVVHISTGISGLVAALYIGVRRGYPKTAMSPSNMVMTMMGAGLLWVGWFGFNAGSSVSSNLSTAQALTATQVAAATGALSWLIIEGLHTGKATALGFASGVLAGLVAVTPAAGVVRPTGALALGMIASLICYSAILAKNKIGYDDSLDAFGIHGIGGIVGALMLTFFIRDKWMEAAAAAVGGNWGIWHQFGVQAVAVVIAISYAAVVTLILLFIIDKIIGIRTSDTDEMAGLDHSEHGERGYGLLNAN